MTVRRGQVFRHEFAVGGGWGDQLEREPALVLKDARNEKISLRSALEDYGVIIDERSWKVDQAATEIGRRKMRAARPPGGDLKVTWEDPPGSAKPGPVEN